MCSEPYCIKHSWFLNLRRTSLQQHILPGSNTRVLYTPPGENIVLEYTTYPNGRGNHLKRRKILGCIEISRKYRAPPKKKAQGNFEWGRCKRDGTAWKGISYNCYFFGPIPIHRYSISSLVPWSWSWSIPVPHRHYFPGPIPSKFRLHRSTLAPSASVRVPSTPLQYIFWVDLSYRIWWKSS